jgi:hypothetical protein
VWARARVDELLEEAELEPRQADALRATVIGLSLEHQLVTPYTGFAALDEAIANVGGQPVRVRVSQPLPQGLKFGAFQPQPPVAWAASMPAPSAPMARGMGRMMGQKRAFSLHEDAEGLMAEAGMHTMLPVDSVQPSAPVPGTAEISALPASREQSLRELARTQRLDGSWEGEVEYTAAALLAFVRGGHTTTAGSSFRQAVRRAAVWLEAHPGVGFASFARARALRELAARTGEPKLRAAADSAADGLGAPQTELERAAASGTPPAGLTRAGDLDTLRLAGLYGVRVDVGFKLGEDPLARVWAALVM